MMRDSSAPVVCIGPKPPPVNGFASITEAMVTELSKIATVKFLDRSPSASKLIQMRDALAIAARYRPRAYYLALSGGAGQIIDVGILLMILAFGRPLYIHHHSFKYLTVGQKQTRLLCWLWPRAVHLVLCDRMAELLINVYEVEKDNVRVLSNAAFMHAQEEEILPANSEGGERCLCIGFLSNITREKGFEEFCAFVVRCSRENIELRAYAVGAVRPSDRRWFEKTLASTDGLVTFLGPLYGEDKNEFLRRMDIFCFPTSYANEAEPLVLIEAASQGAYVVSTDRGCICGMVEPGSGKVSKLEEFSDSALEALKTLAAMRPAERTQLKIEIRQRTRKKIAESKVQLAGLLERIVTT